MGLGLVRWCPQVGITWLVIYQLALGSSQVIRSFYPFSSLFLRDFLTPPGMKREWKTMDGRQGAPVRSGIGCSVTKRGATESVRQQLLRSQGS